MITGGITMPERAYLEVWVELICAMRKGDIIIMGPTDLGIIAPLGVGAVERLQEALGGCTHGLIFTKQDTYLKIERPML
jgi:hypothetical protein